MESEGNLPMNCFELTSTRSEMNTNNYSYATEKGQKVKQYTR